MLGPTVGLGDKGLFLEVRATRSVLGAFIHIKEICFCRIVLLCKFGQTKAKLLFSKYKGFLKNIFFKFPKSFFYQSHVIAFGLTIPKWYNTWVLKIFLEIFFSKIGKNILKNIFDQIFTKNICNTQVLYHFGIVRTNATTWL